MAPAMHSGYAAVASPFHHYALTAIPVTFSILLSTLDIAHQAGLTSRSPFNSLQEDEIDVCWILALFLHLYECGHHMLLSHGLLQALHPIWEITRGYNKR